MADTITITSGDLTAEIAAKGAELRRLVTSEGKDLQWDGDPAFWTGRAPILFPVIGMLNGGHYRLDGQVIAMTKHGFARDSEFEVAAQAPSSVTLRLDANDHTRTLYPFEFRLEITYRLEGARLDIQASVANRGGEPMPASFGFHPALRWPLPFGQARADHRIRFDQDEPAAIRRIDADGLVTPAPRPTPVEGRVLKLRDDLFIDDAVIFDQIRSRRVLYGAETGPQLAVSFADFSVLGVWTKPGSGFICIEPWAGMSDPEGYDGELADKPHSFVVAPCDARTLGMSIEVLANG